MIPEKQKKAGGNPLKNRNTGEEEGEITNSDDDVTKAPETKEEAKGLGAIKENITKDPKSVKKRDSSKRKGPMYETKELTNADRKDHKISKTKEAVDLGATKDIPVNKENDKADVTLDEKLDQTEANSPAKAVGSGSQAYLPGQESSLPSEEPEPPAAPSSTPDPVLAETAPAALDGIEEEELALQNVNTTAILAKYENLFTEDDAKAKKTVDSSAYPAALDASMRSSENGSELGIDPESIKIEVEVDLPPEEDMREEIRRKKLSPAELMKEDLDREEKELKEATIRAKQEFENLKVRRLDLNRKKEEFRVKEEARLAEEARRREEIKKREARLQLEREAEVRRAAKAR